MIKVKIETSNEQVIAFAIARNGFGRYETNEKGQYLIIFPEFSIMEKLFDQFLTGE